MTESHVAALELSSWRRAVAELYAAVRREPDPAQARASRTELVERFVGTDTLVLGTHFADPVGGYIRQRDRARYLAPADS